MQCHYVHSSMSLFRVCENLPVRNSEFTVSMNTSKSPSILFMALLTILIMSWSFALDKPPMWMLDGARQFF